VPTEILSIWVLPNLGKSLVKDCILEVRFQSIPHIPSPRMTRRS